MFLVVGLGNPGTQYHQTKHNIGFMFVDELAVKTSAEFTMSKKFDCYMAEAKIGGKKALLVKPQTYMNLSGKSVAMLTKYYDIDPGKVIVSSDDFNLEVGCVRIKFSGADGGHNGLKSVISEIGADFWRVRIGIGQPTIAPEDYVLAKFSPEDRKTIASVIDKATEEMLNCISKDNLENKTI